MIRVADLGPPDPPLTALQVEVERRDAHALFSAWMVLHHGGARRKRAVDFMAGADLQELWRWLIETRWRR